MSAKKSSIITKKNSDKISKTSKKAMKYVLIAQPGPDSFGKSVTDVRIDLFYKPKLTSGFLSIDRDKNRNKHRQYFLKPTPRPTGNKDWDTARDFFEKLKVGKYEFSISPQTTVGMGVRYKNGIILYVSPNTSLETAFIKALGFIMSQIDYQFEATDLWVIINYITADLITQSVLKNNMRAGQAADMATGL